MVSAVVDPARHSIPVRVRVDNKDGQLRPNDQARVRLLAAPSEGAVEVATSALVSDGEHAYVYVEVSDGKFVRREVVAGAVHDGTLTVMRGLKAGERVVEEGALLLDNQIQLETE
jgi:multidrug efflux pump subunit AcrA (membrane-fusion protein)